MNEAQQRQQLEKSKAKTSKQSGSFRDVQRRQLLAQSKKEEAELQKETEDLIQKMHEEASAGQIPEYGKKIIDVLLNYQGKVPTGFSMRCIF